MAFFPGVISNQISKSRTPPSDRRRKSLTPHQIINKDEKSQTPPFLARQPSFETNISDSIRINSNHITNMEKYIVNINNNDITLYKYDEYDKEKKIEIEKYKIIELLGKGGFGTAYKIESNKIPSKFYVIKISNEKYEPMYTKYNMLLASDLENEVNRFNQYNNNCYDYNIYYTGFTDQDNEFIISDYKGKTTFKKYIDDLYEEAKKTNNFSAYFSKSYNIIKQILNKLKKCSTVLRDNDIKYDNIVIDDETGEANIIDFSKASTVNHMKESIGAQLFTAPEELLTFAFEKEITNDDKESINNLEKRSDYQKLKSQIDTNDFNKYILELYRNKEGIYFNKSDMIGLFYLILYIFCSTNMQLLIHNSLFNMVTYINYYNISKNNPIEFKEKIRKIDEKGNTQTEERIIKKNALNAIIDDINKNLITDLKINMEDFNNFLNNLIKGIFTIDSTKRISYDELSQILEIYFNTLTDLTNNKNIEEKAEEKKEDNLSAKIKYIKYKNKYLELKRLLNKLK